MGNFESMFNMMSIVGIIVPIISIGIFVLAALIIFNPKFRSKFMGTQLKAQKQLIDDNKELIRDLNTTNAELYSDATKIKYRAAAEGIKAGFASDESEEKIFCKHCGKRVDADSKFCNGCGKDPK